jgi:phospholipase A1/A2
LLVAGALALGGTRVAHAQEAAPATQTAAEREPAPNPPTPNAPTPTVPEAEQNAKKAVAEDEPELDVLTFHRSNYFVSGFTRDTQVKFQFSFKYDLWPSTGHHTVYLAYTQKSLWDLYDTSSPFRESNYAPEIFYAHYHSELHGQPNPGCGLFSEQLGVEHESNGEASEASRSWNRVFVDVQATCYGKPGYGLLGLRAWYPFGIAENPKIKSTQGYGELLLGAGLDDDDAHMNGLVTVALRKGTSHKLSKGSVTVDARWRPTYRRLLGKAWKFAPYLWFQLFTGYGETLVTESSATTSLRLGIGFTDRAR